MSIGVYGETCKLINIDGQECDCYIENVDVYLAKGFKRVIPKEVKPEVKSEVKKPVESKPVEKKPVKI